MAIATLEQPFAAELNGRHSNTATTLTKDGIIYAHTGRHKGLYKLEIAPFATPTWLLEEISWDW